jgi:hypothetical protein
MEIVKQIFFEALKNFLVRIYYLIRIYGFINLQHVYGIYNAVTFTQSSINFNMSQCTFCVKSGRDAIFLSSQRAFSKQQSCDYHSMAVCTFIRDRYMTHHITDVPLVLTYDVST